MFSGCETQVYVIEDFSHAIGGKYKNRLVGTIGHVGIASCMGEKPFSLPEGGVLCTNDQTLYERCCAFGHYRYLECREDGEVKPGKVSNEALLRFSGAPIGGVKNRMNPISAAIGIERLKRFTDQVEETDAAINYFQDLLEDSRYFVGHRTHDLNSNMGGWYEPRVFVKDDRARDIANTISSAGYRCHFGHKYYCLANHIMPYADFIRHQLSDQEIQDIYQQVKSTHFSGIDQTSKTLVSIPRFSVFARNVIEKYASLYIRSARSLD